MFVLICLCFAFVVVGDKNVTAEPRMCFPLIREFQAHDILDKDFYPIVRYEQVALPLTCPFHPNHDRFNIAVHGVRKRFLILWLLLSSACC